MGIKDKDGHTICKWKGPQEYQPSVHKRFIEANNTIIQPSTSVSETVKSIFRSIAEVILDTSLNQAMPKKGHGKGDKKGKQEELTRRLKNPKPRINQLKVHFNEANIKIEKKKELSS